MNYWKMADNEIRLKRGHSPKVTYKTISGVGGKDSQWWVEEGGPNWQICYRRRDFNRHDYWWMELPQKVCTSPPHPQLKAK